MDISNALWANMTLERHPISLTVVGSETV